MPHHPIDQQALAAAVATAKRGAGRDTRWLPVIDAAAAWLRARSEVVLDDAGALAGEAPADAVTARVAARLAVLMAEQAQQAAQARQLAGLRAASADRRQRLIELVAQARRAVQQREDARA